MIHRAIAAWLFLAGLSPAQASGQPDPSFGDGGHVIIQVDHEVPDAELPDWPPEPEDAATDALTDHQSRYVAVGYTNYSLGFYGTGFVSRHLQNGAPDPLFSGDGRLSMKFEGNPIMVNHVAE